MNYRAVIFDLDGTLLDSLEDLADSMNSVLARQSFPVHAVEKYRYFVGDGIAELVRRVLPENQRDAAMVAENIRWMSAEYEQRTQPQQSEPPPRLPASIHPHAIHAHAMS